QSLRLNSQSQMQVAGAGIVIVATGFAINSAVVGKSANPSWLTPNLYSGSLTLNSGAAVFGDVAAANGTLTINGQLTGGVACDRLTINGSGRLNLVQTTGNLAVRGAVAIR